MRGQNPKGISSLRIWYSSDKKREEIDLKKLLITAIIMEIGNLITSLMWIWFILFILAGFLLLIIFYFMVPLSIMYLRYYKKSEFSELKVMILFATTFMPATFISMFLTSVLLNMIGIQNYFAFTFFQSTP